MFCLWLLFSCHFPAYQILLPFYENKTGGQKKNLRGFVSK
jgi:hypothetical protein